MRSLPGRRFSTFGVVLQACQDDQGLAVGWHRLVRALVDAGRLVPFTDLRIPSPGSYYPSWNANRELSDATRTLRDWLVAATELVTIAAAIEAMMRSIIIAAGRAIPRSSLERFPK